MFLYWLMETACMSVTVFYMLDYPCFTNSTASSMESSFKTDMTAAMKRHSCSSRLQKSIFLKLTPKHHQTLAVGSVCMPTWKASQRSIEPTTFFLLMGTWLRLSKDSTR
jgi:hypothetical protein